MDYFTTTSKTSNRVTDCVIVGVYDGGKLSAGARDVDSASNGEIRRLLKSGDLSSKAGRTAVLTQRCRCQGEARRGRRLGQSP